MAKKIFITDERMLTLVDLAIQRGLVATQTEFFQKIGFSRTALIRVKAGHQSFTHEQIRKACIITGASADYVYGFSDQIYRKPSKKPMDMLREAVMAMENAAIGR